MLCGLFCLLQVPQRCFAGVPAGKRQSTAGIAAAPEQHAKITGSISPRTALAEDAGKASGNEAFVGVTLLLKQTPSQAAALQKLLSEQQTPGSAQYHNWLSPSGYASRFGLDADGISAVEAWLISQGFTHVGHSAGRISISFDGSASQLEQVFSTEIHRYSIGGRLMLANASDLEVPGDIARFVDGVKNLSQFRPIAQVSLGRAAPAPQWSSADNLMHFVAPSDVQKIYNFTPLLSAGYTGGGMRIAVVGQSSIDPSDTARFRAAAGLKPRMPGLMLVPGTGTALRQTGDELESDIDLEYAGAAAPDADVTLIYTGSDAGHNVFDALAYAVDQNIASIISISYGECETELSGSETAQIERVLMQAAAQGQTVLAASGDSGAAACETPDSRAAGEARNGLGVQYPTSSQYVTSVGGTTFDDSGSASSWATAVSVGGGSARSYIPEQAWNESRTQARPMLLGSGGGASVLFPKPVWQTSPGVPSDGARDVPDIALDAGVFHDGYLLCSSDEGATEVRGSCSHGFLDDPGTHFTVAGGTSFGAPIAAGMVALLSQSGGAGRLGSLNAFFYSIAGRVPDAFHDITTGNNRQPCAAGSRDCPSNGAFGFTAGPGYDRVTGLGTPDLGRLAEALAAPADTITEPVRILLRLLDKTAYVGEPAHILADVSGLDSPEGTVQFFLDGKASGAPSTVGNGQAEYVFSPAVAGPHVVSVVFTSLSGLGTAAASITVATEEAAAAINAFSLSSHPAPSPRGDASASAITVTPSAEYSGRVTFTAAVSDQSLAEYGCYSIQEVGIQAAAAARTTLLVARSTSACINLAALPGVTVRRFQAPPTTAAHLRRQQAPPQGLPRTTSFASGLVEAVSVLFLAGMTRRAKVGAAALIAFSLIVTFCTGCSVTPMSGQAVPGTYTVTLTAADASHSSASASIDVAFTLN